MADPIKASIEVEIDPTPDDFGRFEVHWPNGNRTWPTAENLTALGLPVPAPPGPLIVRVGPNPPCPACNDYGVLSTLDGDTIGPCPECAP